MIRVSSNFTLFWKIFFPTLYLTIFGTLGLFALLGKGEHSAFWSNNTVILVYWVCFLLMITLMYFTILSLKRVEIEEDHFTATNYFKTYRYSINDIETVNHYDYFFLKLVSIRLKAKGKFGRKIRFLPYKVGLNIAGEKWPEIQRIFQTND